MIFRFHVNFPGCSHYSKDSPKKTDASRPFANGKETDPAAWFSTIIPTGFSPFISFLLTIPCPRFPKELLFNQKKHVENHAFPSLGLRISQQHHGEFHPWGFPTWPWLSTEGSQAVLQVDPWPNPYYEMHAIVFAAEILKTSFFSEMCHVFSPWLFWHILGVGEVFGKISYPVDHLGNYHTQISTSTGLCKGPWNLTSAGGRWIVQTKSVRIWGKSQAFTNLKMYLSSHGNAGSR